MEERFKRETEGLVRSWMRYDQKWLGKYLVQDVEDPRINVQSILTRHFLIREIWGERFAALMDQELRFGAVMNWLVRLVKSSSGTKQLYSVLDALLDGSDNAAGREIPCFVSETFTALNSMDDSTCVPDYIGDALVRTPEETGETDINEHIMNTFQMIWRELLEGERSQRASVLEPACGSANDYRFLDSFGVARLLNYTGFDLCEKNIRNARRMFPEVRFEVGNVLEIEAPENGFDYCFVHDLFEHLSIEAMAIAVAEVSRVARRGIWVGFFNMHDGDQHVVKAVDNYHWNNLSKLRMKAEFEKYASAVQVINIKSFLSSRFGWGGFHNKGAYTFVIAMQDE